MFDELKSNSRKFQCFICGKTYSLFNDYNSHVLASHDESRDFIKCPLERCGAACRDLRLHYKLKHPNETLPKNCQMRAMIWKDQNTKTGKLKQRKPKFREGYFISVKNGGKEMHYRSGYECDVYECLESMSEVIKYDVEPFKIQYFFEGNSHQYNPDISILFDDGHIEVWEVKPANQTLLPKNNAKWAAANEYCQIRGWQFMVLTEVGINKLKHRLK